MPTAIASAMVTELQGLGRVFPVCELTLAGTTYRFASEPIASESQGRYEPFVQRWGVIEREIDLRSYSLQTPRVTIDIYDKDRVLQKAIGGPAAGAVIGSAADIVLRSYQVAQASHYTIVDGTILDYRLAADRLWQFVIGPDDRALNAKNEIPVISKADWFRAADSSVGLDGQAVYGKHTSAATSVSGAISCFQVHTVNNWWYVSIGTVHDVTNVWRNGTLATSDFSLTTVTYNGITYSILVDDADTSVVGDEVTADVEGIEDADGETETDPVNMINDFFTNYCTGVSIDSTALATMQTFLSARNQQCKRVIKTSHAPLAVWNEWCDTFKVFPFWSSTWLLAAKPFDCAPDNTYVDSRHIGMSKVLSDIQMSTDKDRVFSRLVGSHTYVDSAGSYEGSNTIEDPDRNLVVVTDQFTCGQV